MADAADSKSAGLWPVGVRVPPPAPNLKSTGLRLYAGAPVSQETQTLQRPAHAFKVGRGVECQFSRGPDALELAVAFTLAAYLNDQVPFFGRDRVVRRLGATFGLGVVKWDLWVCLLCPLCL